MTDDAGSRREPVRPDDEDLDDGSLDEHPTGEPISLESGEAIPPSPEGSGRNQVAAPELVPAGPVPGSKPPRPAKKSGRWWEFPILAAVAILVAILVKTFLVQPFYIPSESMEKTLHGCPGCNGDKILVNKVVYHSRDPHSGEIVVFSAPNGWEPESIKPKTNAVTGAVRWFGQLVGVVPPDEKDLVKRVIAVGGQTIRGTAQGQVQISVAGPNGPWRTLNEPYVYKDSPDSYAQFGPVTVPKGRLWVMGDHRNDSADSRFHCGASLSSCDPVSSTVPVSSVIGKAFVIAWPISRWRTLGTPSTFTSHTSAMSASALPLLAAALVVAPYWWHRRRRRRRCPA